MISVGFIQDKYFSIENLFNKFEIERVSPPILVFNNVFFFFAMSVGKMNTISGKKNVMI